VLKVVRGGMGEKGHGPSPLVSECLVLLISNLRARRIKNDQGGEPVTLKGPFQFLDVRCQKTKNGGGKEFLRESEFLSSFLGGRTREGAVQKKEKEAKGEKNFETKGQKRWGKSERKRRKRSVWEWIGGLKVTRPTKPAARKKPDPASYN